MVLHEKKKKKKGGDDQSCKLRILKHECLNRNAMMTFPVLGTNSKKKKYLEFCESVETASMLTIYTHSQLCKYSCSQWGSNSLHLSRQPAEFEAWIVDKQGFKVLWTLQGCISETVNLLGFYHTTIIQIIQVIQIQTCIINTASLHLIHI